VDTSRPRSHGLAPARSEAGIGHWQRGLARHVWFLRRAGIPSVQIEREVSRDLRQCLKLRPLPVLTRDEEMVPRILAHWQHDCAYLDENGQPRALRIDGRSPSFRSLVRAAVPGADASAALAILKRHRRVSYDREGVVRLLGDDILPRGAPRELLLSETLAALDAVTATGYANYCARRRSGGSLRFQRTVVSDHLDRRSRRAYEEFLNESAQVFLAMHESWLRRHEVKNVDHRRSHLSRVGVGLFGIRGR
jgi:hypothetical protein